MNHNEFFGRKAERVAQDLLGRMLIRVTEKGITAGQITETGAYENDNDTPSRSGMNYAPGCFFLMPYRGTYLLNIATERAGKPSCVEIRGLRFHDRQLKGSGLIAATLDIPYEFDGKPLGTEVKIEGNSAEHSIIKRVNGASPNCVGYFSLKKK